MEKTIWEPYEEYKDHCNVKRFMDKHKIESYEELIARSTDDIEWFWDACLKDLGVEWFRPYSKVLDMSQGFPWARWFIDGKINIVHNTLDRHVKSGRSDAIACIWEGEDGTVTEMSYRDLYEEVNKLSNALKSIGLGKGDAVGVYMPMIPEIVVVMYACLKIGAIFVPVFSASMVGL